MVLSEASTLTSFISDQYTGSTFGMTSSPVVSQANTVAPQPLIASYPAMFWLLVILSFLIIVTNVLVMYVIAVADTLHDATGCLMACLSGADFGVGICLVLPIVYAAFTPEFTGAMCDAIGVISSMTWVVSVYTLMLLSIDRYVCITEPFRYENLVTVRLATIAITIIWLFSAAIWTLPLFGVGGYKFNDEELTCYFNVRAYPIQWVLYMIVIFVPTSSVIIFCYYGIWRAKKNLSASQPINGPTQANMKAVRTLTIIVGAFYLAWTPFVVEHLVIAGQGSIHPPEWLELFAYVLAVANSFWNPIIYVGTNKNFRKTAKKVLTKKITFFRSAPVQPLNA